MASEENNIMDNIRKAIFDYDSELIVTTIKKAIEMDMDPLEVFNNMADNMREIGDLYNKGELFLPDLVAASDAMQAGVPLIEENMKKKGVSKKNEGTVVIGTVYGDIHSIGKSMVCTLLRASGFEVEDLGVNVSSKEFIDAIKKFDPDILAMSALLTTTMNEQKKIISILEKENYREKIKIIVGGAPVTKLFADEIGADGYASSAPGAVKLSKRLIS